MSTDTSRPRVQVSPPPPAPTRAQVRAARLLVSREERGLESNLPPEVYRIARMQPGPR